MLFDVESWPPVPSADRPKPLYVNETLAPEAEATLTQRGWQIVDVRLLPDHSDQERAAAIQATLTGLRVGSIPNRAGLKEYLELEGKTCGLIGNKEPAKPQTENLDKQTLGELLSSFGSTRAGMGLRDQTGPDVKIPPSPKAKKKRS